jgi:hypothetical protein
MLAIWSIALPTFKKSLLKNSFAPLFGITFKEFIFYFSMEENIVNLAKGIRIFRQVYALTP